MFNKYAYIVNNYNLLKAARFMYRVKTAAGAVPVGAPRVPTGRMRPRVRSRKLRQDPLATTGTFEGFNRVSDAYGYAAAARMGGMQPTADGLRYLGYDNATIANMLRGPGQPQMNYGTLDKIIQQRMAAGVRSGMY